MQHRRLATLATLAFLFCCTPFLNAQQPTGGSAQAPASGAGQTTTPDQPAAEDGGPTGDTGAVALPKKSDAEVAPPPAAPKVTNPAGMADYSIRVDVPLVNVDVSVVTDKNHQFVGGLKGGNFRVYEDGVPQKLSGFTKASAPITAVLLLEFANTNYSFIYDMRNAAGAFASQLKPDDYIAVMDYDLHTHILTDFTQDKRRVYEALNTLTIPMFTDRNMFDALYEALDRVSSIEGRKYIILIGSGRDTFSKINLDKMFKKIRTTPDVTIFTVGTGQMVRERAAAYGGMSSSKELDYLQADNQMKNFALMTGGQSYFPMFAGAMPEIFKSINDTIRSAYVLSYRPSNAKMDGTYRKIKVEVVDGEGKPLKMADDKGKPVKYDVVAREGYRAKQSVE